VAQDPPSTLILLAFSDFFGRDPRPSARLEPKKARRRHGTSKGLASWGSQCGQSEKRN
jgi:hypothetical protein